MLTLLLFIHSRNCLQKKYFINIFRFIFFIHSLNFFSIHADKKFLHRSSELKN